MLHRGLTLLNLMTMLASVFAHAVTTQAEPAPSPQGVTRTFAVWFDPDLPAPDFLGEDSIGVIVTSGPKTETDTIQFAPSNVVPSFNDTSWAHAPASATFVTSCPPRTDLGFMWLLTPDTPELPPPGAHAFNSADGAFKILSQQSYAATLCGGSCGSGNGSKYFIPPYGAPNLVVVTAVLSK
jgi:hypothetical protein